MRFARGALPWLLAPLVVAVALVAAGLLSGQAWLAWLALLPTLLLAFFTQFFRDPEREVADGVASPADGRVIRIDQVEDADVGAADRLAIFMSPKDVHVNRFPLDGTVALVRHVPGGHIPAFNKDAHRNERVETLLETELGRVKVIQIAGTVARRIVPYIHGGEAARKGERFGLIRMGSRCDLLVPPGSVEWTVALGQQVYGGRTSVGQPRGPASVRAPARGVGAKRKRARAAAPAQAAASTSPGTRKRTAPARRPAGKGRAPSGRAPKGAGK